MNPTKSYETYPAWTVFLSNAVSVLLYLLGLFVLVQLHWMAAGIFLLYIFYLEYRLVRSHCVSCYYYGKVCAFGKGRISALFFRKGDPRDFCRHPMTWKSMLPDMLVSLIPLFAGIASLILHFRITLLVALILIIGLTTIGNSYVRGSLACRYCKQRELGCPADQLFNPEKKN